MCSGTGTNTITPIGAMHCQSDFSLSKIAIVATLFLTNHYALLMLFTGHNRPASLELMKRVCVGENKRERERAGDE